jgi:ribosomal protein S18 acetylase RimI-like enzyme
MNKTTLFPENEIQLSMGPGEVSDIEFIRNLSLRVFSAYGSYEEVIPSWFVSGISETIVARNGNIPVGFAMIGKFGSCYDFQPASELLAIAVESIVQGRGIGEALLKDLEKKALALGLKRIFLHTATENIKAQRLFIRVGYRPWEIKRGFYALGQDAYLMAKEIDENQVNVSHNGSNTDTG